MCGLSPPKHPQFTPYLKFKMQAISKFGSLALWKVSGRYLLSHIWQSALMLLGITLGVAVVVAIDLANASASRAFDLSTEAVTGRATHQITGGPDGLPQDVYTRLRRGGVVSAAAPVITAYLSSPQLGGSQLQLLGVDPFAEAPFRDYLAGENNLPLVALTGFLTEPGAVILSTELAGRYGFGDCPADLEACQIELDFGGKKYSGWIAGLIQPADSLSARALQDLVLADIATAQEITDNQGRLDRIDLILPADPPGAEQAAIDRIEALLPPGTNLATTAARQGTVEQMTAAFRLNLTALSLLALVVGLFLIYNTMTFTVVQRRGMFGTLRCLGVTRQEVFTLVIGEAILVGLLGAALGIGLGILLGQGAVRLVTQTINDLFFVVSVRGVQIPPLSLIKGGLLGILATVFAAAPPAWEAASVPPRAALSRSGLEDKAKKAVKFVAVAGMVLLLTGALLLAIPTRNLVISFAGTFVIVVGFAMLAPAFTQLFMRLTAPVLGRVWGGLGRLAPRDVVKSLSRTAVAVAALVVAVSVTIGVSLMVSSFRYTVIAWLDQTLLGDVYISAPSPTATNSSTSLDPRIVSQVRSWPAVSRVDVLRAATVASPLGPVNLAATNNPTLVDERILKFSQGSTAQVKAAFASGAVLVSEPFANRFGLPSQGGSVVLTTDRGDRTFPVAGIYYDYASTQGTILMSLDTYRNYWDDPDLTAMALRLAPGAQADDLADQLSAALAPISEFASSA